MEGTININEETCAPYNAQAKTDDTAKAISNAVSALDYLIDAQKGRVPDELTGPCHAIRLVGIDLRRQAMGADPVVRDWILRIASALDFVFECEADNQDYFTTAKHFDGFLCVLDLLRDDLLTLYEGHFVAQPN